MKVKSLKIENVRKITNSTLEFNKPLIILYGETEQGKSTFLDAIKILFAAGFPNDLIQHGKDEANIELKLENGIISRSFYRNKEGEISGRPLHAIVDNQTLSVSAIKKMFNPFQLNQDFLKEMTSTERKRFFVELFGIDTIDIDNQIKINEEKAKDLRSVIKGFGIIELKKIEKPNNENLLKEKEIEEKRLIKLHTDYLTSCDKIKSNWKIKNQKHLQDIIIFNSTQNNLSLNIKSKITALNEINIMLKDNSFESFFNLVAANEFIAKLKQPKQIKKVENLPDPIIESLETDKTKYNAILEQISDSKVNKVLYDNYCKEVAKNEDKKSKELSLKQLVLTNSDLRKEKISKLAEYGKEIENLSFDETGNLIFEGIANDNLSTSQIVRLGSNLSKLFPDSLLSLELLDRAESLGKKIFEFVEKAEKEQTTILATIVGEKPATMPENIGVFVVENGELI
jgi:predicted ATP-dependent endonuclease of OLD family